MIITYNNKQYNTETAPTRQLLKLLKDTYKGDLNDWDYSTECIEKKAAELQALRDVLKAELSKREHIPNKIEAKMIRRNKTLQRRNLNQLKYINR